MAGVVRRELADERDVNDCIAPPGGSRSEVDHKLRCDDDTQSELESWAIVSAL